jgi:hypothetical protein
LTREVEGFKVDRAVTIKGGTINSTTIPATSGNIGIYVPANVTGVVFDGVKIVGADDAKIGIETGANVELTVKNSEISGFTTGIYLNPGSVLTATGNTISNTVAGIGSDKADLTGDVSGNTFNNCTSEGIGLYLPIKADGTVMSKQEAYALAETLVDANNFEDCGTEVKVYGDPEEETGIEGLDADGKRIGFFKTVAEALADSDVDTIVLTREVEGFKVDRAVTIKGGTINSTTIPATSGNIGIYVPANVTGVVFDGVKIVGADDAKIGIETGANVELTVKNSEISGFTTGIYLNPGSVLTATGNTISNTVAGIGSDKADLTGDVSGNTFNNCTSEGIGLYLPIKADGTVMSKQEAYALAETLVDANNFEDCGTEVKVYGDPEEETGIEGLDADGKRIGFFKTVAEALADSDVDTIVLTREVEGFKVDRAVTIKGGTINSTTIPATSGNIGIYVPANVTGVVFDGVKIVGADDAKIGIETGANVELTVKNSEISGFTTGIYLNPGSVLTATGNTISNTVAGIGSDKADLTGDVSGNTFNNCTSEGIGLYLPIKADGTVMSKQEAYALAETLVDANNFEDCGTEVKVYGDPEEETGIEGLDADGKRIGFFKTVAEALADSDVDTIVLTREVEGFKVDRAVTIKGGTINSTTIPATSGNIGIYVPANVTGVVFDGVKIVGADDAKIGIETGANVELTVKNSEISGFTTGIYLNPGSVLTATGNTISNTVAGIGSDKADLTGDVSGNTFNNCTSEGIGLYLPIKADGTVMSKQEAYALAETLVDANNFEDCGTEVKVYGDPEEETGIEGLDADGKRIGFFKTVAEALADSDVDTIVLTREVEGFKVDRAVTIKGGTINSTTIPATSGNIGIYVPANVTGVVFDGVKIVGADDAKIGIETGANVELTVKNSEISGFTTGIYLNPGSVLTATGNTISNTVAGIGSDKADLTGDVSGNTFNNCTSEGIGLYLPIKADGTVMSKQEAYALAETLVDANNFEDCGTEVKVYGDPEEETGIEGLDADGKRIGFFKTVAEALADSDVDTIVLTREVEGFKVDRAVTIKGGTINSTTIPATSGNIGIYVPANVTGVVFDGVKIVGADDAKIGIETGANVELTVKNSEISGFTTGIYLNPGSVLTATGNTISNTVAGIGSDKADLTGDVSGNTFNNCTSEGIGLYLPIKADGTVMSKQEAYALAETLVDANNFEDCGTEVKVYGDPEEETGIEGLDADGKRIGFFKTVAEALADSDVDTIVLTREVEGFKVDRAVTIKGGTINSTTIPATSGNIGIYVPANVTGVVFDGVKIVGADDAKIGIETGANVELTVKNSEISGFTTGIYLNPGSVLTATGNTISNTVAGIGSDKADLTGDVSGNTFNNCTSEGIGLYLPIKADGTVMSKQEAYALAETLVDANNFEDCGTEVKVYGDPEEETGIEGLDADGKRIGFFETVAEALADSDVDTIVLTREVEGFKVDRAVTIKGGTINSTTIPATSGNIGIYVPANVTGVVFDGVKIVGADDAKIGIETGANVELTVKNSEISGFTTGIYLNPGSVLTATGNTISNTVAGIGSDKADLTGDVSGNTFNNCTSEGIGLYLPIKADGTVMSKQEADALAETLVDANNFEDCGTEVKVYGDPEEETGIEGLDADGKRIGFFETVAEALADSDVDTIVLTGEVEGFKVDRAVTIKGGTINSTTIPATSGNIGIYVPANVTGVVFDGVKIVGADDAKIGIETGANVELTVKNSEISGFTTGIYLNPGSVLTATGNTISNTVAGIGSDKADLTGDVSGNTFNNCTSEGIGLYLPIKADGTVMSKQEAYALAETLVDANNFEDCGTEVKVYGDPEEETGIEGLDADGKRIGFFETVAEALADSDVDTIVLTREVEGFKVDRAVTIKGGTINSTTIPATSGNIGIYVPANVTGVVFDGVKIVGADDAKIGIETGANVELTVKNSEISGFTTGIYLNPGSVLTATGNTISNTVAGIGSDKADLTGDVSGNTFNNCTSEGIGLYLPIKADGTVMSKQEAYALAETLVDANNFENCGTEVKVYGDPEEETGIEGLDADGKRIGFFKTVAEALADSDVDTIVLTREVEGFKVDRAVTIKGGTINSTTIPATSGNIGIYVPANVTGVVFDGVKIVGADDAKIGIETGANVELTVKNSEISGFTTGIYLNPGSVLTATGNTISNTVAGIGSDKADLTGDVSGNTFNNCTSEGIGLYLPIKADGTVMSKQEAYALAETLVDANNFEDCGTEVKVYGDPEEETGIEGLDADGKRIGFFETVAEALADSDVDTIVLTGEVEGFKVDRAVTIKGGTINSTTIPATSGNIGIYVPANVTGVVFDGVKIVGADDAKIGIETGANVELTVKNSEISGFTTGIYLNPGSVLTATGNTISNTVAGIGSDKADLTGDVSGNTFNNCTSEGIGLYLPIKADGTVMSKQEAYALAETLVDANNFENCGTEVKVYGDPEEETGIEGLDADGKRIGFFETVAEALADSDVDTIVLTREVEGFKVDRAVTIKGGTINSTTIPATSGNIGIYVPANVTGVVFDGVKIVGADDAKIGIETGANVELTVKNSEISGFTTGIYLNPGSVLTATGNTISNTVAGIGSDKADLTGDVSGNTFNNCTSEGIGLYLPIKADGTVMSKQEAYALAETLVDANNFENCGTEVKVYGDPEEETGIEGLDADGKRIGFFETVAEALADSDVDTIVLTGEVEGFKVDRAVTIKGGTINSTTIPATSGNIGIYVPANVTGVVFDGVKIVGADDAKIGIETGANVELTVKNSEISGFTTGIYLNPGSVLTATGNTISNTVAGIGSDKADLTGDVSGNTFNNCTSEGIGLYLPIKADGTVMSKQEAEALVVQLKDENSFTGCEVEVKIYGELQGDTAMGTEELELMADFAEEEAPVAEEEPDTSPLNTAIEAAIAAKEGIVVSEDGKDVPADTYWVTQEDMDALDAAIAAAEAAKETMDTQQYVADIVADLEAGVATFNDAKQEAIDEGEMRELVEGEELTEDEEPVE